MNPIHPRLRKQYELERELAEEILQAPADERSTVTVKAYQRLYREIPWHSDLVSAQDDLLTQAALIKRCDFYRRQIPKGADVLEVGCGTGSLIAALSSFSGGCVGVEVADVFLKRKEASRLFFARMNAVQLGFSNASFDVALSYQVVEHLHPEDLVSHFAEVVRVLRPGGKYLLETPASLTGPHDISMHFDTEARGLHLKEWSYQELKTLLHTAGFHGLRSQVFPRPLYAQTPSIFRAGYWPVQWFCFVETALRRLPRGPLRSFLAHLFRVGEIFIAAYKPVDAQ